jgi:exopolyphosphatase/guanosine-5'-triphosphate,3'-diphosphate pyrophosphatase
MNSFSKLDLDIVANVARYHRKAHPSQKHLGFSQLSPSNQDVVRKLSALLRVADAFDFKHEQKVKAVTCSVKKSKTLTVAGTGTNLREEIEWAQDKGELLQEVFNLQLVVQRGKLDK